MNRFLLILAATFFLSSCGSVRNWGPGNKGISDIRSLHYLTSVEIPYNMEFRETVVGGLSGITYDHRKKVFYVISDDRSEHSPARFYEVEIGGWQRVPQVDFKNVIFLQTTTGRQFESRAGFLETLEKGKRPKYNTPDPEDIVYIPSHKGFVWVSEGELDSFNGVKMLVHPSVNLMEAGGRMLYAYPIPKQLKFGDVSGPRRNSAIEAVSLSPSEEKLFFCTEEPLIEDAPSLDSYDTGFVRIYQYRNTSRSSEAFYAYPLDIPNDPSIVHSDRKFGISALCALSDSTLLVLERAFIPGEGNKVRLFKVELKTENRVRTRKPLLVEKDYIPLEKSLVLDFNTLEDFPIDNIEGMCLGPVVDGKQTVVFVSDNNFNESQKTIFYLFRTY
ncbi:MAG: esterase-like activity of phytase family protein [Taibaiella sp.]|nr:esterase-like activity of phytase family protein [Taibaiella sp.]